MSGPLLPFVKRLKIVTKDLQVYELGSVMNHAQYQIIDEVERALLEQRRCRFIVLKARQLGVSTIIEGIMFSLAMILKNMSGLVVSHEGDSAKHILNMTNHYWESWPFKGMYSIHHDSVSHKSWVETSSSIRVATAKNADAGRSQTIQVLHGSEVGFWMNALTLMTGLAQSIPDSSPSIVALESTANGIGGYFYDQWNAAVDGDTEYVPMFFPWHEHPQYTASFTGLPLELGKLDEEERVLSRIGLSDDRLAWRRWAIKNKCNGSLLQFHQEYPTTPEEAFVVTGTNIFPDGQLGTCYEPMNGIRGYLVEERGAVRFQESIDGPITVFKWPGDDMDRSKYMVSGDATRSVHGDFSCAQVLNRRTWEQVAVYHARVNPVGFGDQMALLGRYYNWAMLVPEIQGAGDSTISRLISLNYPFLFEHRNAEKIQGMPSASYGWWSGVRAKAECIGNLLKAVVDNDITIHHHQTYTEMRAYVSDGKGGFKNGANEKHDDTVTALAIAVTATMYESVNINASMGVFGGTAGDRMSEIGGVVNKALRVSGMKELAMAGATEGAGVDGGAGVEGDVMVDEGVAPWESWGTRGMEDGDGDG